MPGSDRPDLDALTLLQEQFRDSIDEVSPDAPMPWGGRWKARNLVNHLARVHHWAAAQASRSRELPLGRDALTTSDAYATHAGALAATLAGLDPRQPAWTLLDDGAAPGDRTGTVGFWDRRQKLETLIHLWDLRTAGGLAMEADDSLWRDCVAEVVEVMHPRQLRLARVSAPVARLVLVAADDAWEVSGAPHGAPSVEIFGAPRDLALLCWGRLPLDGGSLRVAGDSLLAREVLDEGLTP
ncbi:maleylpyruvate isomerase family mycothiol-dependent enzyme [Tessaracoccus palaemonis]|uniref:Maleylpyruvate isomerase family mycothiol-dependent enzyme n=1 Tax=Tessaracoccus palaemonis TaxID=2829499 RepID=A0ABX8SJJ1_9ACTN|nr:maleylpyruvate isomerase family mycothiol-dependent enzyme [Tessaracoccus palaemonis]QXT63547.1 maleylpyruvate isomerase family mycothiol-dependent enzyme [Tessaracoccus palaemonis]